MLSRVLLARQRRWTDLGVSEAQRDKLAGHPSVTLGMLSMDKPPQTNGDIHCTVCDSNTRAQGYGQQYGTL
ncbi:hypothetical protein GCM10007421_37140 [Halopseudomonas oceani]|nr:hypothetical protein GCM10007421_37140 [Halopseudomonas oceani]